MAKTIAIQLEVDGVQEAVKTIGQLETAIEQLTDELKETEIGSERFNQLTNELNKARSELKAFEQTFEGLDPQQTTAAYVAFGESVVSGILLAQEALRTFGVENETVNNAVQKSTQAINLALQARIVLEGALEARVIATSIAQRALNTATVQGNRAFKALFTTIAANPLGAVLAVIGLLVTAFISLTDVTDENTEATDENNEALERQNELREAQARIIAQAEAEIALARKNGISGLREQLDILKQRQTILEQDIPLFKEIAREQLLAINQAKFQGQATEELEAALEKTNQQLRVLQEEAGANAKLIASLTTEIDNLVKAASARRLETFKDGLSDTADEVDRLNRSLLEFGDTPEPEIIDSLKELLELQVKLRETAEENRKTLSDVFTEYLDGVEKGKNETDDFGKRVDEIREELTAVFETGNVEDFGSAIAKVQEEFLNEENVKNFTEDQKRAITQILSGYQVAFESLTQLGVDTQEEFENIVIPLLDGLTNKLQLEGKINFEEINGTIQEFELQFKNIEEGTAEFYEKRQELIQEIADTQLEQVNLEALTAEDRKKAQEEAIKLAEEQADAIIDIITNTAAAEDAIRGVLFTTQQLTDELSDTSNDFDEIFGLIITNFDKIEEEFDFEKLLDPSAAIETNLEAITAFLKEVSDEQIDITQFTEEQREEILKAFLDRRKGLIEDSEEDILVVVQEAIDIYNEIGAAIAGLGQALADNTQLQVERVQSNTEQLLEQVVGDSEEAAALRKEIEEESAREIGELQKSARLRDLRLTQLQAVADTASAIVKALQLGPVAGPIAAGIIGTAASIQLATIEAQIADTKSLQFAQGGRVSGPGNGTSDSIPAMLSNGEFVINAKSTQNFLPLLEFINSQGQKFAQGGFVLDNPPVSDLVMNNSTFDDSRLISALERRDTTPIRAYVFEKEITNAQDIEKRLQELSKL